jgi:hypothetical protein
MDHSINIAFSHRNIHFQENQTMALFSKKINNFLLIIKCLSVLSRNYEATC